MGGVRLLEEVEAAREFCEAARARGCPVGLVPTMGALHEGHLSLIRRSRAETGVTVVSVFVNPLQFGAGEDLDAYPRGLDRDVELCEAEGATAVFVPSARRMYPQPAAVSLDFGHLSEALEGRHRPGHFSGVGVVVAKLFAIAGACRAYFGEKDWQQLVVVRRLAADLSFPVEVVGCPTVREPDGLAMSSRNAYLGADERAAAPVLYRALRAGAARISAGERRTATVEDAMAEVLEAEARLDGVDYACAVDAATLVRREQPAGDLRLLVAAHLGGTRLIDNIGASAG